MSWSRFMLGLLVILSLLQVGTTIVAHSQNLLAVSEYALPTVALWVGYLYRYAPPFRIRIVRLLAYFGHQRTSMRVTARFGLTGEVSADDIVMAIRRRYAMAATSEAVKAFPSSGRTIVEMPGWVARFQFSSVAPEEEMADEPHDQPSRELLFTMPDTQNAIESARTLLETDILPLWETLTQDLPLKLEATEVSLRFLKQPNPYLAAYLQNVDLERIAVLNCVIQEPRKDTQTTISRDKIALRATTLADIRNLAAKHLALQWSAR